MTLAFRAEIFGRELFRIWHVDPEVKGDKDSCDWFGLSKTKENGWYRGAVDEYENLAPETKRVIDFVWWQWRHKLSSRPWWKHPRWHIHHWKIQVPFLLDLKRFLFSRCAHCGKRLPWGYSPVSNSWHSTGPQWFRGEKDVFHRDCYESWRVERLGQVQ
jgi:hypothetical protein